MNGAQGLVQFALSNKRALVYSITHTPLHPSHHHLQEAWNSQKILQDFSQCLTMDFRMHGDDSEQGEVACQLSLDRAWIALSNDSSHVPTPNSKLSPGSLKPEGRHQKNTYFNVAPGWGPSHVIWTPPPHLKSAPSVLSLLATTNLRIRNFGTL